MIGERRRDRFLHIFFIIQMRENVKMGKVSRRFLAALSWCERKTTLWTRFSISHFEPSHVHSLFTSDRWPAIGVGVLCTSFKFYESLSRCRLRRQIMFAHGLFKWAIEPRAVHEKHFFALTVYSPTATTHTGNCSRSVGCIIRFNNHIHESDLGSCSGGGKSEKKHNDPKRRERSYPISLMEFTVKM